MAVDGSVTIKAILDASGVVSGVKVINSSVDGIKTDGIANVGTKADAAGTKATGMGKSILGAGALAGAASAVTTAAIGSISGSLDDAISRVDTLNNYPVVMQNLGYSADDADKSINQMSDHLTGLPTALNDMTSLVQQFAASTGGSLQDATDLGLGFNDMMLSANASSDAAASAQYQYNQMLATGNVDMEAWRSIVNAAPGQMNQLAKSMLGAKATQGDLYKALQSGKVSMSDMSKEIVKLDKKGGKGFSSFSKQAKDATGGIGTSMTNTKTAITRTIAKIIDAIGKENITGVINTISTAISNVGKFVTEHKGDIQNAITTAKNALMAVGSWITSNAPIIIAALAGIVAGIVLFKAISIVQAAVGVFNGLKDAIIAATTAQEALNAAQKANIIGLIVTAVALLVAAIVYLWNTNEGFRNAVMAVWSSIVSAVSGYIDSVVKYLTAMVASITSIFMGIYNVVSGIFNLIGAILTGDTQGVVNSINQIFGGLVGIVSGIFGAVYTTITTPIDNARNFIKGAIDAIVGFFGFKISWPHIPVPYFSIKPDGWQIGDLLKGSIPSLDIGWHATGGIFNGPSIIGVGEAGTEAVVPLSSNRMLPFAQAIAANLAGGTAASGNVTNIYIDGVQYQQGSDGAQAVTDLVNALRLDIRRQ